MQFLSTPSARRATQLTNGKRAAIPISIHALREEGDSRGQQARGVTKYFYPRPPRGGRHEKTGEFIEDKEFLSTPSARRATFQVRRHRAPHAISIHALREEGDAVPSYSRFSRSLFLSTPSARRATRANCRRPTPSIYFYPRPPRGGRPLPDDRFIAGIAHFYPRPPRGGRRRGFKPCRTRRAISIHALREEGDETTVENAAKVVVFLSTPSARRATATFGCKPARMVFLSTPSARRATCPCR